jgi:hypothetical protein
VSVHVPSGRVGAAAAVTALLLCTSLAPADAAGAAHAASPARTVGSANWGAVATANTAAPFGTGQLVLTFTNTGTNGQPVFPPKYYTVANTGTLNITGASYSAAAAPSTFTFRVEACASGWNEAADTCAAGRTTVLDTPASNLLSSTVPVAAGSSIRLRASVTAHPKNPPNPTLTVGVDVTRAQVRAATVTGS